MRLRIIVHHDLAGYKRYVLQQHTCFLFGWYDVAFFNRLDDAENAWEVEGKVIKVQR